MARDIGAAICLIDTEDRGRAQYTASYLVLGPEPCLVDAGPATSAEQVAKEIHDAGVSALDLKTIFLTHIHLDHAGATGDLVIEFPNAQVMVHPDAIRHLVDPSRLVNSARQLYGAALDESLGVPKPVPIERILGVVDHTSLDVGDRQMLVIATPGHSAHHLSLHDRATASVFAGDAVGILTRDFPVLIPSTPPPQFDAETALLSICRMRSLHPKRLLLAHYGPIEDADALCLVAHERLRQWRNLALEGRNNPPGRLQERLLRTAVSWLGGASAVDPPSLSTSAVGLTRYVDRRALP